jgi:hypothetical protein
MRFQVFTAACLKITVLWDASPCSLAKKSDVLEVLVSSIIKVKSASETSVSSLKSVLLHTKGKINSSTIIIIK